MTTSGRWASARSTAASKLRSKSSSRWLTPFSVTGRYERPRWASPRAATLLISVDQRADVGGTSFGPRRWRRAIAHDVVPEMDAGRHRKRRFEVGDEALPRHERLHLGPEAGEVLLRRRPQDVAVLLVGQAEDEERVELAQQLVVEQLGLLRHRQQA